MMLLSSVIFYFEVVRTPSAIGQGLGCFYLFLYRRFPPLKKRKSPVFWEAYNTIGVSLFAVINIFGINLVRIFYPSILLILLLDCSYLHMILSLHPSLLNFAMSFLAIIFYSLFDFFDFF